MGFVIIGTGLAGYTLAREFRKLNKDAPLTIITADDGRSYSKPTLSNALAQHKTANQLALASAEQMAAQLPATVLTHTRVTALDPVNKQIHTDQHGSIAYDQLALALGADPIRLPLAGDAADAVLSVNDLGDYARLRQALEGARRVAILGAGLIGCEFANDLRTAGYDVDVIGLAPTPLDRLLPEPAGRELHAALSDIGVNWHLGTSLARVDHAKTGLHLTLTNGVLLASDVALSCIGLRPRTALAAQAGLAINQAITVDRYLVSSTPDIFALGDCAEVEGWVLPYVMPLMNAARALAKTWASGELTAVSYPAMPVVVKTPAYPIVVCPPPRNASGAWQIEALEHGIRARYISPDGRLLGYALTGALTAERQALTKEVPGWIQPRIGD